MIRLIAGTDRRLGFEAIAAAAYAAGRLPPGLPMGLFAQAVSQPDDATFPNGCHVAEVEVCAETGRHCRAGCGNAAPDQ